jgi:hypothetical protein
VPRKVVVKSNDLMAAMLALPGSGNSKPLWTDEMDMALIAARRCKPPKMWRDIVVVLGVAENTARSRFRKLEREGL